METGDAWFLGSELRKEPKQDHITSGQGVRGWGNGEGSSATEGGGEIRAPFHSGR